MGGNTTSSTQEIMTKILNKVSASVITNNINKSGGSASNSAVINFDNNKVCGPSVFDQSKEKQYATINLKTLASSNTKNTIATEMVSGIMNKLQQMQKNGSLQTGIDDKNKLNQKIKNSVENIISTEITTNNWNSCTTTAYNKAVMNITGNEFTDCKAGVKVEQSGLDQIAENISSCKMINGVANSISNAIHNIVESESGQIQISTGMLQDLFNGVSKVMKNLPFGSMSLGSLTSMGNPASSMGSSVFSCICCCCLVMAALGLMLAASGHKGKKSSGSYGPQSIEMTPIGGIGGPGGPGGYGQGIKMSSMGPPSGYGFGQGRYQ